MERARDEVTRRALQSQPGVLCKSAQDDGGHACPLYPMRIERWSVARFHASRTGASAVP